MNVSNQHYTSYLTGNTADVQRQTRGGAVLMGGGTDVDEAFRWMLDHAGGGDFLVLRASGADGYNPYISGLAPVDSVESVVCHDREASFDTELIAKIDSAEAIFLAGGDQGEYMALWKDTPVQEALNRAIERGIPVGGTSAGLAVLGESVFAAREGGVSSDEVLKDPFQPRITLEKSFIHLHPLEGVLTDTHFSQRDRMGRLITFLARLNQDPQHPPVRGFAADERTAGLMEANGEGRVVGENHVYLVSPAGPPEVCEPGQPLTYRNVHVDKLKAGDHFDFRTWQGNGGDASVLSVENGILLTPSSGDHNAQP